ncbi:hypothetical protein [Rhodococcus sp. UNC23MFCrub1.1]|uniref:hypothetical protein n=1 Tax=Rhodococcus sp. UNC23MFCrub1.1 TaxID=1449068 RepID=UPI0012DD717F|nr:hypothetical protein [Rhodococcus sp. UNC23MFCrub1.1]
MTSASVTRSPITAAPGLIVEVRDAEGLVTKGNPVSDGFVAYVIGPSELVPDTSAHFITGFGDTQVCSDLWTVLPTMSR